MHGMGISGMRGTSGGVLVLVPETVRWLHEAGLVRDDHCGDAGQLLFAEPGHEDASPGHCLRRLDRHRGRRLRGGGHPDLQGAGDRRPDVFHRVAADGHCRHQADLFPLRENRKRGPVRSSFFHRCRYRSTTVTSWPVWGRKTCSRSSVRRRRLASFLQGWQPNQAASWTARSITSRTRRSVS